MYRPAIAVKSVVVTHTEDDNKRDAAGPRIMIPSHFVVIGDATKHAAVTISSCLCKYISYEEVTLFSEATDQNADGQHMERTLLDFLALACDVFFIPEHEKYPTRPLREKRQSLFVST